MAPPCWNHVTFRPFSARGVRHKLELLAAVHVSRGDNTYVSLFCACRQSNENSRPSNPVSMDKFCSLVDRGIGRIDLTEQLERFRDSQVLGDIVKHRFLVLLREFRIPPLGVG